MSLTNWYLLYTKESTMDDMILTQRKINTIENLVFEAVAFKQEERILDARLALLVRDTHKKTYPSGLSVYKDWLNKVHSINLTFPGRGSSEDYFISLPQKLERPEDMSTTEACEQWDEDSHVYAKDGRNFAEVTATPEILEVWHLLEAFWDRKRQLGFHLRRVLSRSRTIKELFDKVPALKNLFPPEWGKDDSLDKDDPHAALSAANLQQLLEKYT